LLKKKEKLFNTKKIKEWELENLPKDEIKQALENFQKAEKYMLPKESIEIENVEEINQFLNKHILFEFFNFDLLSQFYIEDNFASFSAKLKEEFENPNCLWNLFENQKEIDVSLLDRSQTSLI